MCSLNFSKNSASVPGCFSFMYFISMPSFSICSIWLFMRFPCFSLNLSSAISPCTGCVFCPFKAWNTNFF